MATNKTINRYQTYIESVQKQGFGKKVSREAKDRQKTFCEAAYSVDDL
jgi:hypothetical protein